MKLKTATFLAICGAAGMAITFAVDWILRKIGISSELYYESIEPLLSIINLISRFLIMIFFISLYKNQK
jgi:hypothetical protein